MLVFFEIRILSISNTFLNPFLNQCFLVPSVSGNQCKDHVAIRAPTDFDNLGPKLNMDMGVWTSS